MTDETKETAAKSQEEHKQVLTAREIQDLLPHRYPFLLVDKMILLPRPDALQLEPGMKMAGIKNVTFNEPHFQGHFPGTPIMPGVLIIEALAQCAGVGGLLVPENKGKLALLTGIEDMKIRRQVVPGDVLLLEIEVMAFRREMGRVAAKASVDGAIAAQGIIKFALIPG